VFLIETPNTEKAYALVSQHQKAIACVFFYGQGVLSCTSPAWQTFATTLLVCSKSAEHYKIDTHFLAGLPTFVAYALQAEQVIQIK